jgi:16S rRNA pseudouridine516 synthase
VKLARYLMALGYGSRREVERLCAAGRVRSCAGDRLSAEQSIASVGHDAVRVEDEPLDPPPGSVWLLHKPEAVICSTRETGRLVYDLLPPRLRARTPIVAPVGRLDRQTTGLLLLTDDGPLLHRLTSPRSHLPKTYVAELAEPLRGDEGARFAAGTLCLEGEDAPLRPAHLDARDGRRVALTITEGRYHQVRRMFAAVGHHVCTLHRESLGPLGLGDLPVGAWRLLDCEERAHLDRAVDAARAHHRQAAARHAARGTPTAGAPPSGVVPPAP